MNIEDRYDGFFTNITSAQVYDDKYKHGDETPLDTIDRVAKFLSTRDAEYQAFYNVMKDGKAYPAGRTMANANIGEHLTLNNCFVPYQVPNDMGEIYECVKIGALTHKAGGGTGYDFSLLAPNGTKTHNNAIASGPVSFMKSFDAQTDTVKSGNRRGANMGVLNVYHPDIREFINAKATDANVLQYFNLSVMVDDEFMRRVETNDTICLHYPVYNEKGKIETDPDKWEQTKNVSAKELWDEIMTMAYNNGEPGILQYNTMNLDNNLWYVENIVATNPCFTGDMELYIEENGMLLSVPFKDLEGREDITVFAPYAEEYKSRNNKVWCSGVKEIVAIYCEGAKKPIKCTPDHVFRLWNGEECKAEDLVNKKICGVHVEQRGDDAIFSVYPSFVVGIEYLGEEKVYDFTESETHWGVVSGAIVHNCGEYLAGTLYGDDIDPTKYGGACNLGSILLHKFIVYPFSSTAHFNRREFKQVVRTMVRMLDNTIDVNTFPVDIYENYQKAFRTIGLGITGLADAIAMLGMKYNSDDALRWTEDVMDTLAYTAYQESVELAKEKGAFPMFDADCFVQSGYLQKHCFEPIGKHNKWDDLCADIKKYGIRNARLISVAPTGTMSMVWGNNCSSGCEPIFSLEYDRVAKIGGQEEENKQTIHVEDYAYNIAKALGADTSHMTTALELTVDEHIDMLSVIARHTDMSVSKTINVPTDYPFEDAKNIYMRCWKERIKGCTIFRPNEIRQGILGVSTEDKTEEDGHIDKQNLGRGDILSVSDDLIGFKRRIRTGCGVFYFSVWFDEFDGTPLETFIDLSKAGGCERNLQYESKLMSKMLRGGIDAREIIDAGKEGFACMAYCNRKKEYGDTAKGISCPSALAWALEDLIAKMKERCFSDLDMGITEEEFEEAMLDAPVKVMSPEASQSERVQVATKSCPECGEPMPDGAGCITCPHCGFNSCEHS